MAINTSAGQNIDGQTTDNFWLSQGTATSTAAAATVNLPIARVTTEALTTAAGAIYTFTLTNSLITANSFVTLSVALGTSSTGVPTVTSVTPGAGSVVAIIQNIHASAALNGTLILNFFKMN